MTGIDRLRNLAYGWDSKVISSIADQIDRELREALKSDTSDGRDTQNPSWHDPADAAGVTFEAKKVTRDPAEDVSMSAYDLLPADERDALAWVREHGGLERIKNLLNWVVGHCSTKQQLDFDFWLSGRAMYALGFDEDMADRDEVERRLLARLVPEGIVRCRGCRRSFEERGELWCRGIVGPPVEPDGFCAWGERGDA